MRHSLSIAAFALSAIWVPALAHAHISVEQGGGDMVSRDGDGELKVAPCGKEGSVRGTNVKTYQAGETIQISIIETIPHPGYFRIAFDDDGDDDFVEPASIKPLDPNRACPFNAADKCGTSDFYNSTTVLPGMDNLDPHVPTSFTQPKYTWDVTLPDVNCDNCTLQIMQVMEDTIHGAYNPVPGDPADVPYVADNYHQCIDLTLVGATGSGDAGPVVGADGGGGDDGGCSVAAGRAGVGGRGSSLAFAAILAVLGLRLRNRRVPARVL